MTKFKKFVFVYEISYIAEDIDDAKDQQQNESEGWYIKHQDFEFKKTVIPDDYEIRNRLDEIKELDDFIKSEEIKEKQEAEQICSKCGDNPN
jgi:hypothetical protein